MGRLRAQLQPLTRIFCVLARGRIAGEGVGRLKVQNGPGSTNLPKIESALPACIPREYFPRARFVDLTLLIFL